MSSTAFLLVLLALGGSGLLFVYLRDQARRLSTPLRNSRDEADMAAYRQEHRKDRYVGVHDQFTIQPWGDGNAYELIRGDWKLRLGEDHTGSYRPMGAWWDDFAEMASHLRPLTISRWIPVEGSFGKWGCGLEDAPEWRPTKPPFDDCTMTAPRAKEFAPETLYDWEGTASLYVDLAARSPKDVQQLLVNIMERIQKQTTLDQESVEKICRESWQETHSRPGGRR